MSILFIIFKTLNISLSVNSPLPLGSNLKTRNCPNKTKFLGSDGMNPNEMLFSFTSAPDLTQEEDD